MENFGISKEERLLRSQKRQWWIITVLLCIIVFLATTVIYATSLKTGMEKSNVLAKALADLNNLLPEGNQYIDPINDILKTTGYGKLRREVKITEKKTEGKNE